MIYSTPLTSWIAKNTIYQKNFVYDRAHGCVCYGGPNNYSWGWVVDDFGNHVIPHAQVTGWGMYEASLGAY